MQELTKAEEQIMNILWGIGKGFVKDIIEKIPEPKPAYNTVSTVIRILEKKSYVGHEDFGKVYCYFPLISKSEYTSHFMKGFVKKYFDNSYKDMVSFFAKEDNLSLIELEQIINEIEN